MYCLLRNPKFLQPDAQNCFQGDQNRYDTSHIFSFYVFRCVISAVNKHSEIQHKVLTWTPLIAGHITVESSSLYLAIQKQCFFKQRAAQLLAVGRGICGRGGIMAEQHCLGRSYQLFMRPFCTYGASCQRQADRWRDNMVLQHTIRLTGPTPVFVSTSKKNRGGFCLFFFPMASHHKISVCTKQTNGFLLDFLAETRLVGFV